MAKPTRQPANGGRVRSLRIGVILGGKIIEEKLLRKREPITIGQSSKNNFSVPIEGLPRTWTLFQVKDNQYYLNVSESMDGRISDGSSVQPLAAMRQSSARDGDGWALPLSDTSRGKIVLGDMTLLFQFVTAPPLQPRPHLPASVRGSLADRVDPQLAVIVAVSIAMHMGVMLYARCFVDPPLTKAEQIYRDTFPDEYEDTFEPQVAEVDVDVGEEAETGGGEEDKPEDEPKTRPKPSTPKPSTGDSGGDSGSSRDSKSDEELAEEAAVAIAGMFGDDDPDSTRSGTNMGDRNPGNDLADEAANVEEGRTRVTLSDTGSDQGPSRSTRRRASTSGPDVKAGGGRESSGTAGPAKVPKKPNVNVGRPDVDESTSLTPAAILAKIRRQYTYGLKQCFKKVLKIDETASGTVRLKFTIGERGSVTRAEARGFGYDTLDRCVESQARKWRFSPPKDEDGDSTEMTVKLSLPFTGR